MAHPDHDQVIGRLAGARLRGAASRGPGRAPAAEAHPEAETWAAYVDGGLLPDEVTRLEHHLAGCGACRRLVAALVPEVSADAVPAARDAVGAAPTEPGRVLAFPGRRQVFVWMGVAASLFAAVTVWSVSRLGSNARVAELAVTVPPPDATAPPAAPVSPQSAAGGGRAAAAPAGGADTPESSSLDRLEPRPTGSPQRRLSQAEQDKARAKTDGDTLARRRGSAAESARPAEERPAEEKRFTDVAVAVDPRQVQLQTNTVAAGSARPRGPLANQASNTPPGAPAAPAPPPASAAAPSQATSVSPSQPTSLPPPMVAAGPSPAPASAPAAAKPDAAKVAAQADARERRDNEQQAGLAEVVATTGGAAGSRTAARPPARAQAVGEDAAGAALAKDEAGAAAAFGFIAPALVFAEPGGRLRWRIVKGTTIESSSDGGTTWTSRPIPRGARLRAGTAPSIDSAWAVGEKGLVLRLSVPGGWTAVAQPAPVTLIAVSATGAQSARVTAADGRVFETADGGATWTLATPGAGPQ